MAANATFSGKNISKQININPTILAGESERGEKFWNRSVTEMKFLVENQWLRAVRSLPDTKKPNYGMAKMDPVLEEITGNKLELVGPILDSFLKEIGLNFESKLARSKFTGLMSPTTIFIPYSIFRHVWVLASGYGARIEVKGNAVTIIVCRRSTATSIWAAARFSGQNFLSKRLFEKVPMEGRKIYQYKGKAEVVVTAGTPLTINYNIKQERATITFYVQRYDKDDFAQDSSLQKLMISD